MRLFLHAEVADHADDEAADDVDEHIPHRVGQAVAVGHIVRGARHGLPVHDDLGALDDGILPALHVGAEQAVERPFDQFPHVFAGHGEAEGEQHHEKGRELVYAHAVVQEPHHRKAQQRKDDAARGVQHLVVQKHVVVGAEDLAQHEVREHPHVQHDGDEVGEIAAEFALDEQRDVEDDQRAHALKDVVDGDVQPALLFEKVNDDGRGHRQHGDGLQDPVEDDGVAALLPNGRVHRALLLAEVLQSLV